MGKCPNQLEEKEEKALEPPGGWGRRRLQRPGEWVLEVVRGISSQESSKRP